MSASLRCVACLDVRVQPPARPCSMLAVLRLAYARSCLCDAYARRGQIYNRVRALGYMYGVGSGVERTAEAGAGQVYI